MSLSKEFDSAVTQAENFHRSSNTAQFVQDYNKVASQLKAVDDKVDQLSLFSNNETLDDVSTENIKYIATKYHIAKFMEQYGGFSQGSASDRRERVATLAAVRRLYMNYLHRCRDYDLLEAKQQNFLDDIKDSHNPSLAELQPGDAATRRQAKIDAHKQEKLFTEALKVLDDPDTLDQMDDEVVRQILTDQLRLFALKSFQSLEDDTLELELLKNMIRMAGEDRPQPPPLQQPKGLFDKGYTDRLEMKNTELISKKGKVLKPFTLVSRDDAHAKVQGYGQKLPTMTVEELVDQELKNGGMVSESKHEEVDEDDIDAQDRELYHQREFDEFKDSHAKGSGNMKGNNG